MRRETALRQSEPATEKLQIVAGGGANATDGVQATTFKPGNPRDISVDSSGNPYIADQGGPTIRKAAAVNGSITTKGCSAYGSAITLYAGTVGI